MATGIKGLIKGTQTLGEMLANTANKIADMFLDMAISQTFSALKLPGFVVKLTTPSAIYGPKKYRSFNTSIFSMLYGENSNN